MSLVLLRNIPFEKIIPSDDGTDPLGSLRTFSKEIIEMILFHSLDFNSKHLGVGYLSQASKATRDNICGWLKTRFFSKLIARKIVLVNIPNDIWLSGCPLLPRINHDFVVFIYRIGSLLRMATATFPIMERLHFFIHRMEKISFHVQEIRPDFPHNILIAISGHILMVITHGWKKSELRIVFSAVSVWKSIPQKIAEFLSSPVGSDSQKEIDLRVLLLSTFSMLNDHSINQFPCFWFRKWISILFSSVETLQDKAKLVFLLYAPIEEIEDKQYGIEWNFQSAEEFDWDYIESLNRACQSLLREMELEFDSERAIFLTALFQIPTAWPLAAVCAFFFAHYDNRLDLVQRARDLDQ